MDLDAEEALAPRVFSLGPSPGPGNNGPSSALDGRNASPAVSAFSAALTAAACTGAAGPVPKPVTSR